MSTETEPGGDALLSPDEAFAVLGDETRLAVLRTLGEADEPLAYSELFDRLEYDDSSNFSYHLDKLRGHFIEKMDDGYTLRRTGERVMEAVLSGAVTSNPVRERTETDKPCPFCGAAIEVGYQHERVTMHCPKCPGLQGLPESEDERFSEQGNLGIRPLPPAGVDGRTPAEMHEVAEIWTATSMQAIGRGVCPRCSGSIEHTVHVCETHDASDGTCDECGLRLAAIASACCSTCIFQMKAPVAGHIAVHPASMAFMLAHGIDPVAPEGVLPFGSVDETIHSHQPFEARYTFSIDGEELEVAVDESLTVVSTVERTASGQE